MSWMFLFGQSLLHNHTNTHFYVIVFQYWTRGQLKVGVNNCNMWTTTKLLFVCSNLSKEMPIIFELVWTIYTILKSIALDFKVHTKCTWLLSSLQQFHFIWFLLVVFAPLPSPCMGIPIPTYLFGSTCKCYKVSKVCCQMI